MRNRLRSAGVTKDPAQGPMNSGGSILVCLLFRVVKPEYAAT